MCTNFHILHFLRVKLNISCFHLRLKWTCRKYYFGHIDADISHLASECNSQAFATCITPTEPISSNPSDVNLLTSVSTMPIYKGEVVLTTPIRAALSNFSAWLRAFRITCCIATHNCCNAVFEIFSTNRSIGCFVDTVGVIKSTEYENIKKKKVEGIISGKNKSNLI